VVLIDDEVYAHVSVTLAAERYEAACTNPGAHCVLLFVNHSHYTATEGPVGWGVAAERPPITAVGQLPLFGAAA
jgi:hypothetical protein